MRRLLPTLLLFLGVVLLPAGPAASAGSVHLDHDAAGQLLRVVPGQGAGVRFQHDAAGNITAVLHDPTVVPPDVSEQTVDRFRCGQATEVTVIGEGLEGARPVAVDDGLGFSDVRYQDGVLKFRVLARCDGIQGETAMRLQTAGGEALLPLTVDPARPALIVRPSPMAVMPGGGVRGFEIALSHADSRVHDIALSISDANIASLDSAAMVTLQPGDNRAHGMIQGHEPGTTVLMLEAQDLGSVSVPLLVTESAAGVNTLLALPLGLSMPVGPRSGPALTISLHQRLGIATGRGLVSVTPSVLNRDAGEQTVQLAMQGMGEIIGQGIHPADGLEIVDSRRLAPDTLELRIQVAEVATVGLRQLRISDEQGPAPALRPGADRLLLAHGHPQIQSVSPNRLRLGDRGVLLTLRGEHLDDALAVIADPPAGVELGAPTVTDAGTRVQTLVSIAPDAEPGPRRLQLRTPAATSDDAASPGNTLHLVTDLGPPVDTLGAPALGIQPFADDAPDPDTPDGRRFAGHPVGMVSGPHLLAIQPDVIVPGAEHRLTLSGRGFHAGQSAMLRPDQGVVELRLDDVAADGATAELLVRLDDDAMSGPRRLRIADGHGTALPPARPGADILRITPAGPRIDSVSPLYLPRGMTSEVTVRGRHLQDVQAITLQPGDGVTAEAALVAEDGGILRFRLAVSAEAAPGARRLQVQTLAGAAAAASSASNTVYITTQGDQPRLALNNALLGLYRPPTPVGDDHSAVVAFESSLSLGVRGPARDAVSPLRSAESFAAALGVHRAPTLFGITPDEFRPGQTATIAIAGQGLDQVASVEMVPADGVILGPLSTGNDDETLTLDLTVGADATAGKRRLLLRSDTGILLPADALADRLLIGPGAPRIDSLSPILAGRGDAGSLLIRGARLQMVSAIHVLGEPGLRLGDFWTSNAEGTELTVNYAVDPDAPRGQRTIQLVVPGDSTSTEASPANSFTVHDQVPD